jgi:hypothetical protein
VDETVKLRPDLAVDHITAPERTPIGMPVDITALVSERNGDVGARADCVLSADGVAIDRATGIWIDANRSVSCLFRPIFSTVGQKHLTVSLVSVDPGDYNPSNNSASASVEVVAASVAIELIGPQATVEVIVARAAAEDVVPLAAAKDCRARKRGGIDDVIAKTAAQLRLLNAGQCEAAAARARQAGISQQKISVVLRADRIQSAAAR